MKSRLLMARLPSKNSGVVNATENASTNAICVPPGLYDLEILCGAITGTSPTCVVQVQEASDGATFTALSDDRTRAIDPTKTTSQRFFFRGIRIVKWGNGLVNAGVKLTVGGTSPVFTGVEATFYPVGNDDDAPNYLGQP
jgi:hypothetical protein